MFYGKGVMYMLQVISPRAEEWRSIVKAIATLIEEASFEFSPEGIKLRSMDPSHIALVNLEWPNTAFEKYVCDQQYLLTVRIEELEKVMKRAEKKDRVEISLGEGDTLKFKLYNGYKREFTVHLIEGEEAQTPLPKVPFTTTAKLSIKTLKKVLSDVSVVSDQVTIKSELDKLLFTGSSELGEASIILERDSPDLLDLAVKEAAEATYSVEYLLSFVKAMSAADYVTIEFASKMPIKLDFLLEEGGVKLQFYLAPRVE
ncbi:proliferating cell nuclear antigen (pcna) [Candidatus Geothermarchaeota archaeon]|nr:MAG: proliferating cell nuclear antigen (pcna) [Candidatus Geothermarchaeota archaeon]